MKVVYISGTEYNGRFLWNTKKTDDLDKININT